MKEITKTSRLAGQLEKLFRMLNEDMFGGQLEQPIITIQSTPRAYGHYSVFPIWTVNGEELRHEINIGAGSLANRPIEEVVSTLLHEMVHYYDDCVLHVQDCSGSSRAYHNKRFKETAESVGLIVTKSERYGWAHTAPSDSLIEWILDHEIEEIRSNRNESSGIKIGGGNNAASGGTGAIPVGTSKPHNFRFECPCCHAIARSGKPLRLICADCMELMI
jgi:hypothetical protein